MLQTPGVTERLAHFVVGTWWDNLKPEVAHQAKRSLMNFFAVALTGCRDSTTETALQTLAAFSGGKQATVIGRRERIDALSAAFLNAASANVLDFCDTHVPTAIHPTAPVVPALLAVAEMTPVSGRDLLLALVLGHEVECRIGAAMSPSHYKRGWHITSTCGVFGAAVGAGKLLGLNAEQMIAALGTAATQSGGLCECLGTPAKSVSVGNAARNGLLAALLAAENFDGPSEPLTGAQGYYHALNETADLSFLTSGLGKTWEILGTAYKPYPCGFVIHPVLDCVLDWRRGNPAAVVEKVVVTGNPLLAVRTDRPDISNGRQAQVSTQHAVAAALLRGAAGVDEFTDACVSDSADCGVARRHPCGARRNIQDHLGRGRDHDQRRQGAQGRAACGARQRRQPDERCRSRSQAADGGHGCHSGPGHRAADRGHLAIGQERGYFRAGAAHRAPRLRSSAP